MGVTDQVITHSLLDTSWSLETNLIHNYHKEHKNIAKSIDSVLVLHDTWNVATIYIRRIIKNIASYISSFL